MAQTHFIKKMIFDLQVTDPDEGHSLQSMISRHCRDGLLETMKEVFDEVAANTRLTIDRLEVDLKSFDSREAFIHALNTEIKYKLRETLAQYAPGFEWQSSTTQDTEISTLKISQGKIFEIFSIFLESGVLPWNAVNIERQRLISGLITSLKKDPQLRIKLKQQLGENKTAVRRLIVQLTDNELIDVLTILSPMPSLTSRWQIHMMQEIFFHSLLSQSRFQSWEIILDTIVDYNITDFRQVVSRGIAKLIRALPESPVEMRRDALLKLANNPAFAEVADHFARYMTFIPSEESSTEENITRTEQDELVYVDDLLGDDPRLLAQGITDSRQAPHPASRPSENNMLQPNNHAALVDDTRRTEADLSTQFENQAASADDGARAENNLGYFKDDFHKISESMNLVDELDLHSLTITRKTSPLVYETNPADKTSFRPSSDMAEFFVENGGLVLATPFLNHFFEVCGLKDKEGFIDISSRAKAVHLLQYLVSGEENHPEYELFLNKILCGYDHQAPIDLIVELTESDKAEADELLAALIKNWPSLKKTSPKTLQTSFFKRRGIITLENDTWLLRIKRMSIDILLDTLPWSYSMVKYSWMAKALRVEW